MTRIYIGLLIIGALVGGGMLVQAWLADRGALVDRIEAKEKADEIEDDVRRASDGDLVDGIVRERD